jgi:hypothetical protein
MQERLQEIRKHLREDIEKVDEPQLTAMFETSAEVLGKGPPEVIVAKDRKAYPQWKRLSVIYQTNSFPSGNLI